MGEVRYMISEAAKRVNVETHVLRHWEDELGLTIGRTEMGHRYYTEDDVRLFNCIKELKEQGMLLKELKDLIPDLLRTRQKLKAQKHLAMIAENAEDGTKEIETDTTLSELQLALLKNNQILQDAITQSVIKEMGYLFLAQEQQEEERYKRLDCLIRQQQSYRKEFAKNTPLRHLRRIFEG